MSITTYAVRSTRARTGSYDEAQAAADAINRRLGDSGRSDDRAAVDEAIAACHPDISAALAVEECES